MSHLSLASLSAVIVVTWARMVVMLVLPRVISLLTEPVLGLAQKPRAMLLLPVPAIKPASKPMKTLLVPPVLP